MTINWKKPLFWRRLVQWSFLLWTVFLGVQFALFVRHFETGGETPLYVRPPGVEGFLPIGGLVSLKHWFVSGDLHPAHPAAAVLMATILAVALLTRKSFCSWLCPVGTLSEALGDLGKKLFGRSFRIWTWLDLPLRGVKYLLLFFFLKIILLDMPTAALGAFLDGPYWAVSDVRMLHFFTRMSILTMSVLLFLSLISLLYRDFWCRYLCPYGALLGLLAVASPLRIRRRPEACSGCGACSRVCRSRLPVAEKKGIISPECTACLSCVQACPRNSALRISMPGGRALPWGGFAAIVLLLFAVGVGAGMLSGQWQSALTYEDFRLLIPLAESFSH